MATEYREAAEAVIAGFIDEQVQAEEERRTLAALRIWKRFMVGLRIKERVDTYEVEGEEPHPMFDDDVADQDDDDDSGMQSEEYVDDGAGGFLVE